MFYCYKVTSDPFKLERRELLNMPFMVLEKLAVSLSISTLLYNLTQIFRLNVELSFIFFSCTRSLLAPLIISSCYYVACPVQKASRSLSVLIATTVPRLKASIHFLALLKLAILPSWERESECLASSVLTPHVHILWLHKAFVPAQNAVVHLFLILSALLNGGSTATCAIASFPCPKVLIGFLQLRISVLNVTQLS